MSVCVEQTTADECTKQLVCIEQLESDTTRAMERCSSRRERRLLTERFQAVKSSTSAVQRAASNLASALSHWLDCCNTLKDLQSRCGRIEDRFEHHQTADDSNELSTAEVQRAQQDVIVLEPKCEYHTKQLASCRVSVIDNVSRCRIDIRSECSHLRQVIDSIMSSLCSRDERRNKLATSWSEFQVQRQDLISLLENMETRLNNTEVDESSLSGVERVDRTLEHIKVEIGLLNEKYDTVRSLGRSLIASACLEDDDEAERARQSLAFVAERWEHVQRVASDMRNTVTSVILRWKLFGEAEREVSTALECWRHVTGEMPVVVHTDAEARKHLNTFEVGRRTAI